MDQPTPAITAADVERIVRSDFPSDRFDSVISLLAEYGGKTWHQEPHRVRLAVLKLADGQLEALRREIETARCDYRDVLAGAEYSSYMKKTFGIAQLPVEEQRSIIDEDWKQYDSWFKR